MIMHDILVNLVLYLNIYHSLGLGKMYKELANMCIQIAKVEMYHLDIIGQVITLLG